jgi:hypothetical protein
MADDDEEKQRRRERWDRVHVNGDRQPPMSRAIGARIGRFISQVRREKRDG